MLSAALSFSLLFFYFYFFIYYQERVVYAVCSRSRVITIIIIPVAISSPVPVQPLNDTGPAAVHRNICFCVTYPFGRRTVDEE